MKRFPWMPAGRMRAGLLTLGMVAAAGSLAEFSDSAAFVGRAQGGDRVSPTAQASATKALSWLITAQNGDGSWGDNPGSPGQVGNTCIATLALLATGDTMTCGRHCIRIRRGVQWVMQRTKGYAAGTELDSGTLLQRKLGQNIPLYLAALLYTQVVGHGLDEHDDERMMRELRSMCDSIQSFQKPNGEWESSYEPSLTTIAAWLALRQAAAVGVSVRGASTDKVTSYLKSKYDAGSGVFRDAKWGNRMRFVMQAGALRVLYGIGEQRSTEAVKGTAVMLGMRFDQDVGGRSGGEEFLGALYATQAMHIERGKAHRVWYPKIVKALIRCQNRDGSWVGHHCITGRVFCTATSIMSLVTPNKMLPMLER